MLLLCLEGFSHADLCHVTIAIFVMLLLCQEGLFSSCFGAMNAFLMLLCAKNAFLMLPCANKAFCYVALC